MCYMIYFDNSATSFYKPEQVKNTLNQSINKLTANPGRSGHKLSQRIAEEIFETREAVKRFFHAPNYQVFFTKNCTESLNFAIFGLLSEGDHVISTIYEHNSVLRPLEYLKRKSVDVTIIDAEMEDIPNVIETNIKSNTKLVITTSVSNVTGEVCDIKRIGKICKEHNILYLVDGAQASGHLDINLSELNIDMYAFSGHKGLLSITGVGGLVIRENIKLKPLLYGGTGTDSANLLQPTNIPDGLEAGTIPTIPILTLKAGIDFLSKNFKNLQKIEENLTKYLYNSLKNLKFLKIYSKDTSKNIALINIKDMDSSLVANILDEKFNICVRAGLHCAPLIHKHLGTLESGAVRISIDFNNTRQEIDKLVSALKKISDS